MQLTGLKPLYIDMCKNNMKRQEFKFVYNGIEADVFFFIDQKPFILAFGILYTQSYFEIPVNSGFMVDNYFNHETFEIICREFHIKFDPTHTFKVSDFLVSVNQHIPQTVDGTKTADPKSIAKYRSDYEESDKIYFCGFRSHIKDGRHVTRLNLDKTKKLMGEDAYRRCKNENVSTQWTTEENKDRYNIWKQLKAEEG